MNDEQKNPTLYDYLRQFHSVYETSILTDKAIVLYWQMVSMFNACGWKQWVGVDTARLMAMIHETNKTTAYRARDKLVDAKLIEYRKGHKGKPSMYRLCYNDVTEKFFCYTSVTENVTLNVTESVTENDTHHKNKDLRQKTSIIPPNPPTGGTGDATLSPETDEPPQAEPSPPKAKRGTRQKDPAKSPELTPDEESALLAYSPGLCDAVRDWFRYKAERRQMYGETFRRRFLGQVAKNASQYGVDAVTELIENCLSSGYQGVIWDKLPQMARNVSPQYGGNRANVADWDSIFDKLEGEMGHDATGDP